VRCPYFASGSWCAYRAHLGVIQPVQPGPRTT
jgi:hypothetical protein